MITDCEKIHVKVTFIYDMSWLRHAPITANTQRGKVNLYDINKNVIGCIDPCEPYSFKCSTLYNEAEISVYATFDKEFFLDYDRMQAGIFMILPKKL